MDDQDSETTSQFTTDTITQALDFLSKIQQVHLVPLALTQHSRLVLCPGDEILVVERGSEIACHIVNRVTFVLHDQPLATPGGKERRLLTQYIRRE
jgi:hypothetical protein